MNEMVERKNVLWMIILRITLYSLLLVMSFIIEYSASFNFSFGPFLRIILAVFALSGIYAGLYTWGKALKFQAYLQIILDVLVITALVYLSGGTSSAAYFLYIFPILGAGFVISDRAGYLTAGLAAILFGGLTDGLYLGLIPYVEGVQASDLSLGSVLYTVALAWGAFFLVAFLTNTISGRLRRTRAALREAQRELSISDRLSEAGRISATLAHEIRNPLAAISGSVQVLKREIRLNAEQQELMDIVLRESQRVSHNLEQFLDFALPAKQVFSVISLSDIMDETLKMLRGGGELNGRVEIQGNFLGAGLHYFGSAGQFKQVFLNLVKNSIKAMPGGGRLSIDFSAPRKKEIELRFSDSGRGFSEEDKKHLFEPFYSGFEGGRGLGLSIVRRIVDDYDGKIDIRSELNKGTEIVITLPVREQPKR